MGAAILLGLSMIVVAALGIREALLFRSGTHVITRTAFVLRMVNTALLLVVLAMLLFGTLATSDAEPRTMLVFWSTCVVLFLICIVIAINDLRMLRKVHHDRCQEVRKRIMNWPGDDGKHKPKRS